MRVIQAGGFSWLYRCLRSRSNCLSRQATQANISVDRRLYEASEARDIGMYQT